MNIWESIKLGIIGIWSHKLRSLLTMLGVIFGIAAVIAIVAIGEGAREEALRQIRLMGVNNIRIKYQAPAFGEISTEILAKSRGLTYEDYLKLESSGKEFIDYATPVKEFTVPLTGTKEIPEVKIVGTLPFYTFVNQAGLENSQDSKLRSRFISDTDVAQRAKVCVLGAEVKRKLFTFHPAVGQSVNINNVIFRVVGVLEDYNTGSKQEGTRKNSGGLIDVRNIDMDIYIPLTTAYENFPLDNKVTPLDEISIKVKDEVDVYAVSAFVNKMLSRRHKNVKDIEIIIPEELLRQEQATQRTWSIVLVGIASLSLLVGGIGIMNIMLANVTQRTREIGIRRSIGATQSDILRQFLIECLVISLTGGLIGIITGIILGQIITLYAGWVTIISIKAIFISVGVSGAVGMIFGIYPASKASRLDPIQALRYE
jgi:ABC-type antimicrobial peptide transport system permease subunit